MFTFHGIHEGGHENKPKTGISVKKKSGKFFFDLKVKKSKKALEEALV